MKRIRPLVEKVNAAQYHMALDNLARSMRVSPVIAEEFALKYLQLHHDNHPATFNSLALMRDYLKWVSKTVEIDDEQRDAQRTDSSSVLPSVAATERKTQNDEDGS